MSFFSAVSGNKKEGGERDRVIRSVRGQNAYLTGMEAERIAADFLRGNGYCILETRYKTPFGEIDLIARLNEETVFVEVKARRTLDEAAFSLSPRMKKRITAAAQSYLSSPDSAARFDVLAVDEEGAISHIENAWMVEEMI